MAQIPINIEASCSQHPLLKQGAALPRVGQTRVSQQRLFTLGSLWLQDNKKAQFRTYKATQAAWSFLNMRYATYLTFSAQQLTTDADSEMLTDLSEVVGVALGIAAMNAQFDVNLNRFRKFATPGVATRRLDFEYYSNNQRFFHETKGTTHVTSVQGMCNAIDDQKQQTQAFVLNQPGQIAISGCTGSIAQYRHVNRTNFISQVTVIDPPPPDAADTRASGENDELACVLRYYQNFYAVTHTSSEKDGRLGLADWLAGVANGLEEGRPAPVKAPATLRANARATEPDAPDSLYRGTYFDARLGKRNVLEYATFAEASARIAEPVTFLGVSQEVTELVQGCRWDELLEYFDRNAATKHRDGTDVSESGIMSKRIVSDEIEENSRKSFPQLRRVYRRMYGLDTIR
jgi:hypothetical protein